MEIVLFVAEVSRFVERLAEDASVRTEDSEVTAMYRDIGQPVARAWIFRDRAGFRL